MPLFPRLSCVRRCANCSQIAISAGQTSVCGACPRLTVRTEPQFSLSRGNSRTKIQNVVTGSTACKLTHWLLSEFHLRLSRSSVSLLQIAIDASQSTVRPRRQTILSTRYNVGKHKFFAARLLSTVLAGHVVTLNSHRSPPPVLGIRVASTHRCAPPMRVGEQRKSLRFVPIDRRSKRLSRDPLGKNLQC